MPIPESLCCLALNQLNIGPVLAVVRVAADHVTDQSRGLLDALERSNRKAWKALEVALAGESLWGRLTDRAETKAFRAQIRQFIDHMPLPELTGKAEFRKRCLAEIREATSKGVLLGNLVAGELAEKTGKFAAYADPNALLQAEKAALTRLGKEVQDAGFRTLGWLLAQPAHGGQSVVVVAARYFLRREIETNAELFRGLQYTAVESLGEAQKDGFRGLDEALTAAAAHLDEALAEAAAEILAAVAAVGADVKAAHETAKATHETAKAVHDTAKATHETAKAVHDSVQSLAADLQTQMAAVLAKLDMANKPVQPEHSMALRSDREKELVRELLKKVRAAPESAQPVLAAGAGKLQIAIGDFTGAAESFAAAAARAGSSSERAEAFHNSYRAKLEQKDYAGAVADLKRAVQIDPGRFAPFPTDKYELVRILGAGGFGVTFQCKHAMTGAAVAVKSLTDQNLEQDAGAVLREASALDKIKHPAIIGLRDCGYADTAGKKRPYLVMEYFDGQTLQDYVDKKGPLPLAEGLTLARTLAEALAAAHGQNVLHRDVKPANVMVKRVGLAWEVRLIDFGLAMRSSVLAESMSTARGQTMLGSSIAGTIDYAAPEQLGKLPGVKVGPPADVYGFAKTLCYALFQTAEPTHKHYKSVPDGLAELIGRCLSREPRERPQTFQQVLTSLAAPPKPAPKQDEDEDEDFATKPKKKKAEEDRRKKRRRGDDDDDYDHDHRRDYDDDDDYDRPRGPLVTTGTRLMHALMAWILGLFGIHKFMQGNASNGILRIVLLFTCFGIFINVMTGIVEGLIYATMTNELYAREYLIRKKSWF